MFKTKILLTLFFAGIISSSALFAQSIPSMRNGQYKEQPEVQEKEVEPKIQSWQLSGFGAFHDSTKLDTLQDFFHLYHPVFKNTITATYVGNFGTPYLNNDFFGRKSIQDFFFLQTREAYILTPSSIKYYNTRTPYTLLDYSQSENKNRKNETRFNVLHTQNVNPYWNFTFRYDQARSDGQYIYQDAKNNFVSLYSSYNKDNIGIHAGFINNSLHNSENGGLEDDLSIFNGLDSELLNVKLNNSYSEFNNFYFFANSEYRFGKLIEIENEPNDETIEQDELPADSTRFRPILGIMYSVIYQRNYKQFVDNEDATNTFFANTYYSDDYLNDSIRFNKISNVFQLKQYENADRKTSFGKRAFIGQEFVKVTSPRSQIETVSSRIEKYSNVFVGGGIFRETGNFWTWNAEGKFYLLGRNIGQTELTGIISKPMKFLNDSLATLTISGAIENLVPDYFQEEFYSNHIRWRNDLNMEQNMTVKGRFTLPRYNLEMGANYALINNYIYNDTLGIPSQTNKELLVLSAYVDKDFNYRNLHFRTRVLWQKASNEEYIHLPDFSVFISAYYKFLWSKVLHTQIGIDARYNTSYYADAYDPSTGLFYLQDEKMIGNFPYIDVYANLRLKRTRLFFKMKNIGTEFINREYFTTPHHPMNRMTFRLGVAWAFYD